MIIDRLNNASSYLNVHRRFAAAFDYLRKADLSKAEPGSYEVDGRKLYVLVQEYETKPKESGRWEAHRRYIDIQYVHGGQELFGYANLSDFNPRHYDEAKDFLTLEGEGKGDFFLLREGSFAILLPQDAHMPGIAAASPQQVKKLVVKVAIEG